MRCPVTAFRVTLRGFVHSSHWCHPWGSCCRLLPPRQNAKLLLGKEMVGRGANDHVLTLIGLFRWPDCPELQVQHKVVSDFERPGNEEWNINQRVARKQEAGKDGTERGSRGSRYSGDSTGRGAFLWPHHSHRVGLPGRHVHLADAESDEQ